MIRFFFQISNSKKIYISIIIYLIITFLYWTIKPLPQGLFVIPLYLVSISFPWKKSWPVVPLTILVAFFKPVYYKMSPLPIIIHNYLIVTGVFVLLFTLGAQLRTAYHDLNETKEKLAYLYKQAKELSNIDYLTGLGNHRFFQQSLAQQIDIARSNNTNLALILFDLDNFKFFNDTFGHQSGDIVLKEIAQIVRESLRENDIPCRYGGEEFVVILPNTNVSEAKLIAEKIRCAIEAKNFLPQNRSETETEVTITISGGCSCFPDQASTPTDLIKVADQKLYEVKRSSKNRIA